MRKVIDLTGKVFSRLTVLERDNDYIKPNGTHILMWKCLCECGNVVTIMGFNLKNGNTKSCGCLNKDIITKHGHSKNGKRDRLCDIWHGMKQRCNNPNDKYFHIYGGENKKVCSDWQGEHGAENFINWALTHGYSDDLTLDRIDNTKGYTPENCRWATPKEQSNNKRDNHCLEYNGITKTMAQWSDTFGIKQQTISTRLSRGWSVEKALTTPINKKRGYDEITMKRKNLKLFRVKHDLTQEQMAIKLGVCKATYNFIEIGKRQGNIEFWKSLQNYFDIPDEQMYGLMEIE